MPSSAVTVPKRFFSPSTAIAGPPAVAAAGARPFWRELMAFTVAPTVEAVKQFEPSIIDLVEE
jgi:hypothetical protein